MLVKGVRKEHSEARELGFCPKGARREGVACEGLESSATFQTLLLPPLDEVRAANGRHNAVSHRAQWRGRFEWQWQP